MPNLANTIGKSRQHRRIRSSYVGPMPSTNAGDDGSDQQLLSRSALLVGSSSRHRVWQSRSGIEGVTVVAIVSVVDIALDVDRDDYFVVTAATVAPVAMVTQVALEALVATVAMVLPDPTSVDVK